MAVPETVRIRWWAAGQKWMSATSPPYLSSRVPRESVRSQNLEVLRPGDEPVPHGWSAGTAVQSDLFGALWAIWTAPLGPMSRDLPPIMICPF